MLEQSGPGVGTVSQRCLRHVRNVQHVEQFVFGMTHQGGQQFTWNECVNKRNKSPDTIRCTAATICPTVHSVWLYVDVFLFFACCLSHGHCY